MIEDIIYYSVLALAFVIMVTDIVAVVSSNVRNAGKFIRCIRFITYSITPAIYFIMILAVLLIGINYFNFVYEIIIISMLVIGCFTAYAEKILTLKKAKKSDKKRVRRKNLEFCKKLGYGRQKY